LLRARYKSYERHAARSTALTTATLRWIADLAEIRDKAPNKRRQTQQTRSRRVAQPATD